LLLIAIAGKFCIRLFRASEAMVFGRDGDVLSFLDSVQRAVTSPCDTIAEPAQERFEVSSGDR
jgi:hypothetical protein